MVSFRVGRIGFPATAPVSIVHWHNEWVTFPDSSSGVLTVLDSIDPNALSLSISIFDATTTYYVEGFVIGHRYQVTAVSTGVSQVIIHCFAGDNPFESFYFADGVGSGTFDAPIYLTISAIDAAEPPPAVGTGTVTFIDLGPA